MSWEATGTFVGVIVALCALWLTISESRERRKHNRLSVKPYLTTWTTSEPESGHYLFDVVNNGIGPALIKSFQIYVDGIVVEGVGPKMIDNTLKKLFPNAGYTAKQSYLAPGYMMPANEKRPLVDVVSKRQGVPSPQDVEAAQKRIRLVIDYQSIYQDKYRYDSDVSRPIGAS